MNPQIIQKQIISEKDIEFLSEGFLRMSSQQTHIPVDIFVNEDNMKEYTVFPVVIMFRNSYYPDARDYMPMTVSENPILLSEKPINIFKKDLYKIVDWVIKYRDLLIALSEEKISNFEFLDEYNYFESKKWKRRIYENVNYTPKYKIYEMAKLRPYDSGLRYTIWLDEDKTYLKGGHSYRIKVQPVDGEKASRNYNELTIDGEWIGDSGKRYSPKDKKAILKFLNDNKELIKQLSDKKINFEKFKECFKKYTPNDIEDIADPEDEYKVIYDFENDFSMVINPDGWLNILSPDGELLNDEWFSYIEYILKRDKVGEYFQCLGLNNERYKLYTDGRFIRI